jgi:hypothetical protein
VLPPAWYVQTLRPAGDTDNDGVADVVALVSNQSSPANPVPTLLVLSRRTGAPLLTVPDAALQGAFDLLGFGDANNDGRSDLAPPSASAAPASVFASCGSSSAAIAASRAALHSCSIISTSRDFEPWNAPTSPSSSIISSSRVARALPAGTWAATRSQESA